MRLKKLMICGFKSFAEKASLEFSPGITAIVGPNGCGKSNIVDSFRWVMGEQSAKAIRGDKMLDIIFAGAGKRKPVNMAEVTLTFTDVDGELPIDFGEVSICRRVFRNGESEFFINRKPVRLKDIESLFWDTGLGKDAFCIFEQGKIEQVIQNSPAERRVIFEEAAGILRFKQRKKEALRKLEQAEANFSRAQDIYQEVHQQAEILEKQAQEAIAYKQKKSELEELEKLLFFEKWEKINQKQSSLQEQFELEKTQLTAILEEKSTLDADVFAKRGLYKEKENRSRTCTEQLFQAKSTKEVRGVEWRSHKTHLEDSEKKAARFLQDLELLQQRRQKSRGEFEINSRDFQIVEEEAKKAEHDLKEIRVQANQLKMKNDQLRDQQKGLQQERLQISQQENKIKSQLQEYRMRLENGRERLSKISTNEERLEALIVELTQAEHEKRELLNQTSVSIDEKKKTLTDAEQQITHVQEALKACAEELKHMHKEKTELHARQKVLLRLKEDMEGLSGGTKRLLQESRQAKSPLYGKLQPLYEQLSAEGGYEMAVASALRPYSQTLVVQTLQDAQTVLEFAKANNLKEFSLLCYEEFCDGKDLQCTAESGETLLSHLPGSPIACHFFQGIYLIEDIAQARSEKERERFASWMTKEGFFKDRLSVLFSPIHAEKNTFLREAELKGLVSSLSHIETGQAEAEKRLADLEEKKQKMQSERSELDKALRIHEMKLVEINFGLQRAIADRDKAVNDKQQSQRDLASVKESLEAAAKQQEEWIEKDAVLKREIEEKQRNFQSVEEELQQCLSAAKKQDDRLREAEFDFRKKSDAFQRLTHLCQLFKATDQEQEAQERRLQEEYKQHLEKKAALAEKSPAIEEAVAEAERVVQESARLLSEAEKEVAVCRQELALLEDHVQKILERIKDQETKLHRREIQMAEEKTALGSLEEGFLNQYQMTVDQVRAEIVGNPSPLPKMSIDRREKRVRELRRDLESAGDVNLAAVEEFEKHRIREEFLRQQLEDMQRSKDELIQIIAKLDDESRKIFEEAFVQIRRNFQKNFNILFEGGEADIAFTESGDYLDAGIDIIAKPPGKQMRSISLLSGGEKCLTAMALLFAIFEVRPSAFCLLDEVDAPLDEANVRRFTKMIQQFVDKTQFIIITHNKCTMSIADMLFGVSMEEKGVSKVLSLVFEKQPEEEPVQSLSGN